MGTTYFAGNFSTAFFEGFSEFRETDISACTHPLIFDRSELNEREYIELTLKKELCLLDLTAESALNILRLSTHALNDLDLSEANEFADHVVAFGKHDGIHYNSRFGGDGAIVLFSTCEKKISTAKDAKRTNLMKELQKHDSFMQKMEIEICDGIKT